MKIFYVCENCGEIIPTWDKTDPAGWLTLGGASKLRKYPLDFCSKECLRKWLS